MAAFNAEVAKELIELAKKCLDQHREGKRVNIETVNQDEFMHHILHAVEGADPAGLIETSFADTLGRANEGCWMHRGGKPSVFRSSDEFLVATAMKQ